MTVTSATITPASAARGQADPAPGADPGRTSGIDAQGIDTQEIAAQHREHVLQSWSVSGGPVHTITRAEGIWLWDETGRRIADMSSLMVCANLGHGHPRIAEAIAEQARRFCFMSPAFATEPKSRLAARLVALAGQEHFARVMFTNGGAESNEHALRIARTVTGRTKVFSSYRSYHGATAGAAQATGDWRRLGAEQGAGAGFVKFLSPHPYQDGWSGGAEDAAATDRALADLERQLRFEGPETVAAIIVEPVVGANGVIIPPEGYLPGLRRLCDRYGILLIFDEVMTGFGRTGTMFAWQVFSVVPDLMTFAKGVDNAAVPLGGVLVSREIARFFEEHPLPGGLTYSGHTLACAAANAALDAYEQDGVLEHVAQTAPVLAEFLDRMAREHECVGQVRHLGMFAAVELVSNREARTPLVGYRSSDPVMKQIIGRLYDRGFSTFGRENTLHVSPPLTITTQELEQVLPILDEVLGWVDREVLPARRAAAKDRED